MRHVADAGEFLDIDVQTFETCCHLIGCDVSTILLRFKDLTLKMALYLYN